MFTFLHAADIHLDSPLHSLEQYEGAPVQEIRSACRRAFVRLIDLAMKEKVAFLLLAGDLYDGDWKDYNTGLFFIKQMGRLQDVAIPVFIVLGNHDAASRLTKNLRLPPNVHVFSHKRPESVRLETLAVTIHGWSFATREVSQNMAQDFPPADPHCFNIGLLHTALSGRPGHEPYAPCTVEDLLRLGYDYWALGHVHQHEIVNENPWIVFPGNIQGRHIHENGNKGAVLVRVVEDDVESVEFCPLDVFRWHSHTLIADTCDDDEELLAAVSAVLAEIAAGANGRGVAVRLEIADYPHYQVQSGSQRERLENEIRAQGILQGDLWLEKLVFSRGKSVQLKKIPGNSSLQDLVQTIAELQKKPEELSTLLPDLQAFVKNLPSELPERDNLLACDPDVTKVLLDNVTSLLLGMARGDSQ